MLTWEFADPVVASSTCQGNVEPALTRRFATGLEVGGAESRSYFDLVGNDKLCAHHLSSDAPTVAMLGGERFKELPSCDAGSVY
jgi:hypothetical protein